jgi:hypothetical protein
MGRVWQHAITEPLKTRRNIAPEYIDRACTLSIACPLSETRMTNKTEPTRDGYITTTTPDTNNWQTFLMMVSLLLGVGVVGATLQWLFT